MTTKTQAEKQQIYEKYEYVLSYKWYHTFVAQRQLLEWFLGKRLPSIERELR